MYNLHHVQYSRIHIILYIYIYSVLVHVCVYKSRRVYRFLIICNIKPSRMTCHNFGGGDTSAFFFSPFSLYFGSKTNGFLTQYYKLYCHSKDHTVCKRFHWRFYIQRQINRVPITQSRYANYDKGTYKCIIHVKDKKAILRAFQICPWE